ncbi:MAG: peptidylprolyl isomerase [Ruminococcaceae bacterium]|nr:peptidylprolyl isomerase [Oscillospiraceae bacterium]
MNYPFDILETKEKLNCKITLDNEEVIELELYPDIAPISVSNFKYLASKGFYNGLIFHRVVEGFMIQGGCPEGRGTGGPGYHIKGEFLSNGVENNLKHERGVISMARAFDFDSAGSQFFIMHKDAPHLDGQYAAFGKVIDGMDVVDKIAKEKVDFSDKPLCDVIIKSITVE